MERTVTMHMEVMQEGSGWALYMPLDYLEAFLKKPLEVPFRLDKDRLVKAAPELKAQAQKLNAAGLQRLRLQFDEQGRVSTHLALVTRRRDESYNETAHRLMDEATEKCRALLNGVLEEAAPRFRLRQVSRDYFDQMERALWRLRGQVSLLRACDINRAAEVAWEEVGDAMEACIDELKDSFEGLHGEWVKALAEDGNAEASPTAGKQSEEASGD